MKKSKLFALIGFMVIMLIYINFMTLSYIDCSFQIQPENEICKLTLTGFEKKDMSYNTIPQESSKELPPMIFNGLGSIGHGKLSNGSIYFKKSDLIATSNSFYLANIDIPITFGKTTRNVYLNLRCVRVDPEDSSHNFLLFNSMNKSTEKYEFAYMYFFNELNKGYRENLVEGNAEIQAGDDIVLNTGFSRGTEIIEAKEGSEAIFLIQFSFIELRADTHLNCNAGIVSTNPAYSIEVPLDIYYEYKE